MKKITASTEAVQAVEKVQIYLGFFFVLWYN